MAVLRTSPEFHSHFIRLVPDRLNGRVAVRMSYFEKIVNKADGEGRVKNEGAGRAFPPARREG